MTHEFNERFGVGIEIAQDDTITRGPIQQKNIQSVAPMGEAHSAVLVRSAFSHTPGARREDRIAVHIEPCTERCQTLNLLLWNSAISSRPDAD